MNDEIPYSKKKKVKKMEYLIAKLQDTKLQT